MEVDFGDVFDPGVEQGEAAEILQGEGIFSRALWEVSHSACSMGSARWPSEEIGDRATTWVNLLGMPWGGLYCRWQERGYLAKRTHGIGWAFRHCPRYLIGPVKPKGVLV